VRCANDVCLVKMERVHEGNHAVGTGGDTGIKAWYALRQPHSKKINRIYSGGAGKVLQVIAPRIGGADEAVNQDKRRAIANLDIVHTRTAIGCLVEWNLYPTILKLTGIACCCHPRGQAHVDLPHYNWSAFGPRYDPITEMVNCEQRMPDSRWNWQEKLGIRRNQSFENLTKVFGEIFKQPFTEGRLHGGQFRCGGVGCASEEMVGFRNPNEAFGWGCSSEYSFEVMDGSVTVMVAKEEELGKGAVGEEWVGIASESCTIQRDIDGKSDGYKGLYAVVIMCGVEGDGGAEGETGGEDGQVEVVVEPVEGGEDIFALADAAVVFAVAEANRAEVEAEDGQA